MEDDFDYWMIEGDHNVISGEALTRGWCHKHGSKARVMRLKRGKAALWAEVQGQGQEVYRGRNVCKRCARTETWCLYYQCRRKGRCSHGAALRKSGKHTVKLRNINFRGRGSGIRTRALAFQELELHQTHWQSNVELESEDECVGVQTATLWTSSDLKEGGWTMEAKEHCDDASSSVSTFEESTISDSMPFVVEDSSRPQLLTQWEVAVLRAEVAALAYARGLCSIARSPEGPQRFPKTKNWKSQRLKKKKEVKFGDIRAGFLKRHGPTVLAALKTCFQEPIELRHAPLSAEVQMRFASAFAANSGRLVPCFHGTNSNLHDAIFDGGLLIPGQGNNLQVRHGSAHGLGIYTAKVNSPWLSRGFCSAPRMLVCGVLDDSVHLNPYHMASFAVSRESEMIRHVGNAMVVFDSSRVAPFFEAVGNGFVAQDHQARGKRGSAGTATSRATAAKEAKRAQQRLWMSCLMSQSSAAAYIMRRAARRRRGY